MLFILERIIRGLLKMTVKDIERLEKIDQLMFNFNNAQDAQVQISKAGQLLKKIGMITNSSNINEILTIYNQNVDHEIKNAIRKKTAATVKFNPTILQPLLKSKDEMAYEVIQNWQKDSTRYAQIVLRFRDKMNTWRAEENETNYQQLASHLDRTRHNIHNTCIDDLAILNRLTSSFHDEYATWDNANIKRIEDVPRGDIGNAIILQYLDELKKREKLVLVKLKNK